MMGGDATELLMGRNMKALEKSRERVSLDTMKGSTTVGVPEDMKMVGIGSMPPPEAGYDLSDSLYMETMVKVEKLKREEKKKAEETELLQYRMESSLASSRPPTKLALNSAVDTNIEDIVRQVIVKKRKKKESNYKKAKIKLSKDNVTDDKNNLLSLVVYSSDDDGLMSK